MPPSHAAQRMLLSLSTTLLPFLYQTRTILGRVPRKSFARANPQVRRITVASEIAGQRRPSTTRGPAEEEFTNAVPFESEQEAAFHQQRNSTITETERKTFEKLFKRYNAPTAADNSFQLDADEDWAGTADDTLDSILNDAMSDEQVDATQSSGSSGMTPRERRDLMRRSAMHQEEEDTLLKTERRKEQFERIERLLKAAKSDIELWNVLETEVLSVIRRLNLDAPRPPPDQAMETENEDPFTTLEIIGPNYPSLMLVAIRQLRVEFPGSTLGLALLPTIKSLGRGSYALGASTELYNELLAMTWLTYSDFQGLDDLLAEMNNGGIDFNANTLDLLDSIKRNALDSRRGDRGEAASVILEMERFRRGTRRLQRWRDAIRMRMEADVIRQAKDRNLRV